MNEPSQKTPRASLDARVYVAQRVAPLQVHILSARVEQATICGLSVPDGDTWVRVPGHSANHDLCTPCTRGSGHGE